ncbi:hypothetical protein PG985_015811 [Apiospora marii]|uniref:Uncharacterized protein n=1 Tax=Apiospora marii TaxID=335849 RepID=A0ABR1S5M1_9PEZI
MLASTETMSPPTQAGLYFDPPLLDRATFTTGLKPQPSFKKHKHLPRPKQNNPLTVNPKLRTPHPLSIDTTLSSVSSLSSRSGTTSANPAPSIRDVRASGGPDLPPTPPAHSRTSSSGQSVQPSSPTYVETPVKSVAGNSDAQRTPGTPPNQRSPPTPDVTPPQLAKRPKPFRPSLADRMPSKATNDSRTASFTTARETPYSSEDEKATLQRINSERTSSQNTVRQVSDVRNNDKKSQNVGLGLGLESDDNVTPTKSKQDFFTFDGDWDARDEVEQEWDDNLNRNVIVRKRRPQTNNNQPKDRRNKPAEVIEDETVTPTNATKALRTMPLQQRMHVASSPPREPVDQGSSKRWPAPSASASSVSTDVKRFSGMSSKSTVSTIVEAILVDAPPQRQKTLRHVKKQITLRDSGSDVSQSSSAANSSALEESSKRLRPRGRPPTARTDSLASTGTANSISSRKARRDVWKNGGIPVVVIPDRKASVKGAGTPSLRSTSSRRTQRSNSIGSVPLSGVSKTKESTPVFDRPTRRSRAMSESDGSLPGDQRTIDYPPIVPVRSSSLSAPTSRNGSLAGSRAGSRSGSLTSESLRAHNTFAQEDQQRQQHQQQLQQALQNPPRVKVERAPSVEYIPAESDFHHERQLQPAPSVESHRDAHDQRSLVDHNGDPFFGKRLTTQNTPFSIASVETNGTHSAAEVSEAMAVNIYPHQNKSVVMVDHGSKILDANTLQTGNLLGAKDGTAPEQTNTTTATAPADGVPVTPPQPIFSVDDVDSPLRNPRAPPEPPVIKFIPATPSGLTPAAEKMKMLGNYFEETPEKRPSALKRAFSVRNKSDSDDTGRSPGFLTRTFSLSRNLRRGNADSSTSASGQRPALYRSSTDSSIPDEERLHPYWRPLSSHWDPDTDEDWVRDIDGDDMDTVYRYPPIDNRPSSRRPSLSSRMKRTFAILPITDDAHYTTTDGNDTQRRTIKRTPSGNLRVMRYRDSLNSIRWGRRSSEEGRPSTAPESSSSSPSKPSRPGRRTWGAEKRFDAQGRRFFPSWQDKLEGYSPQALGRRLSERKRQKRSQELRSKISGPREVRDGVGEVIKRNSYKGPSYQSTPRISPASNSGFSGLQQQQQQQAPPQRQPGHRGLQRTPKIQAMV